MPPAPCSTGYARSSKANWSMRVKACDSRDRNNILLSRVQAGATRP